MVDCYMSLTVPYAIQLAKQLAPHGVKARPASHPKPTTSVRADGCSDALRSGSRSSFSPTTMLARATRLTDPETGQAVV